jgi:hypothetical protein
MKKKGGNLHVGEKTGYLKVGDYGLYKYSGYDDYDNKDINVPSH